jgi:hypothetical protein
MDSGFDRFKMVVFGQKRPMRFQDHGESMIAVSFGKGAVNGDRLAFRTSVSSGSMGTP